MFRKLLNRRLAAAVIGVPAALALAFGVTAAASAGVVTGPGTTDGTAGYFATQLGTTFRTGAASFTLIPQDLNIGVTSSLANPKGAIGTGLCNNGTGQAAELGAVLTSPTTFSIVDAYGTLPANNADPCVNNGILTDGMVLHPLLTGLPVGTGVSLLIRQYPNKIVFAGENLNTTQSFSVAIATRTCTPGHWSMYFPHRHPHIVWRPAVCTGGHPYFNEALDGVMQNLTLLGGPATNDLVDFWGVTANNFPLGAFNAESVTSSGTGNSPWLVGPAQTTSHGPNGEACSNGNGALQNFGSKFSVCVATPVGA